MNNINEALITKKPIRLLKRSAALDIIDDMFDESSMHQKIVHNLRVLFEKAVKDNKVRMIIVNETQFGMVIRTLVILLYIPIFYVTKDRDFLNTVNTKFKRFLRETATIAEITGALAFYNPRLDKIFFIVENKYSKHHANTIRIILNNKNLFYIIVIHELTHCFARHYTDRYKTLFKRTLDTYYTNLIDIIVKKYKIDIDEQTKSQFTRVLLDGLIAAEGMKFSINTYKKIFKKLFEIHSQLAKIYVSLVATMYNVSDRYMRCTIEDLHDVTLRAYKGIMSNIDYLYTCQEILITSEVAAVLAFNYKTDNRYDMIVKKLISWA